MTIPIQNLLDLPEGASYRAEEGRSSVEATKVDNDNVKIKGACDSIRRKCLYYESQVFRQRQTIDSLSAELTGAYNRVADLETAVQASEAAAVQEEVTQKPPSVWHKWLFAGIVLGIVLSVLAKFLWNRTVVGTFIKGLISKFRKV